MKEYSKVKQEFARRLSASGYGASYEEILSIFKWLTDEEIEVLAYSAYRTAEKLGEDAFDLTSPLEDEAD